MGMKLNAYLKNKNQAIFALSLGVDPSLVTHWKKGRRKITAEMALRIEHATGKEVNRADLRPDLFA